MDFLARLTARFLALASLFVVLVALFALPASADDGAPAVGSLVVALLKAIPPDALIAVIGSILVGLVLPIVFGHLDRAKQDKVLAMTRGAYLVVAAVSQATPMKLDDAVAAVLKRVTDEMGRELKPAEAASVKAVTLAMHADPAKPTIVGPTPEELARHINLPR